MAVVQGSAALMDASAVAELIEQLQKRPDDFRRLERVPLTVSTAAFPYVLTDNQAEHTNSTDASQKYHSIIFLDVETTGLDVNQDEIIELGLVKASFDAKTRQLVSVDEAVSWYEQPTQPISATIQKLTGITDDMVRGQHMDNQQVREWIGDTVNIVAHNAAFDRPFFERRFEELSRLRWACSVRDIDWSALGFESGKLEYLLLKSGWFYEGHRATTDCLALIWLLHQRPDALQQLLSAAKKITHRVRAFAAPFQVKDQLKERGYRWQPEHSAYAKAHWWTEVDDAQLDSERQFLEQLYSQAQSSVVTERVDAWIRYAQP